MEAPISEEGTSVPRGVAECRIGQRPDLIPGVVESWVRPVVFVVAAAAFIVG